MLCWKRQDFRVAQMTTENGGPVSSRRRKNSVLNYYFPDKLTLDSQKSAPFNIIALFNILTRS